MSNAKAIRQAYGEALAEEFSKNKRIVVLDADVSKGTFSYLCRRIDAKRFFNFGIAERNMMGAAAGFAAMGMIPFVNSFAVFLSMRACEQMRTSIAYPRLNVKIVAAQGGISAGEDGVTHQGIEDLGIVRSIPNVTVIIPCDPVETRAAVKAIVVHKGPVYIRLARPSVECILSDDYQFRIGKGVILQNGKDVCILAMGIMVGEVLKAARVLRQKGISASVVNISTLKPIDEALIIMIANETSLIVTVEDHNIIGGLGSAVAEILSEKHPTRLKRIGIRDTFAESGRYPQLLKKYGLSFDTIAKEVELEVKKI